MKVKSIVWCVKKTYSVYAHYDDIGKMKRENRPDQMYTQPYDMKSHKMEIKKRKAYKHHPTAANVVPPTIPIQRRTRREKEEKKKSKKARP